MSPLLHTFYTLSPSQLRLLDICNTISLKAHCMNLLVVLSFIVFAFFFLGSVCSPLLFAFRRYQSML
jgi:hypothetical protein